jgi:hypothetical protein
LLRGLAGSSLEMVNRSRNPFFLTLLCEHVNRSTTFPTTPHEVIDSAVRRRVQTSVEAPGGDDELIDAGAQVAYTMTASGLGLQPRTDALAAALSDRGVAVDAQLEAALAALQTAPWRPCRPRTSRSGI